MIHIINEDFHSMGSNNDAEMGEDYFHLLQFLELTVKDD